MLQLKEPHINTKYQEYLTRNLQGIDRQTSVEQLWTLFKNAMITAAKKACKTTKISNKKSQRTYWWNDMIKSAVKIKKQKG